MFHLGYRHFLYKFMMKPTLLLLPGLMCDAAVWAPQVQALSGNARCVVPDYGLRDTLTAMAEHVLATAPAERFSLAGHSMGGRVALEVLRLAPLRVQRCPSTWSAEGGANHSLGA